MADHITFFRMKAQPGKRQAVIDHFMRDEEELVRNTPGFVRAIIVANNEDSNELMAGVRFESADAYKANSDDPRTDAWYRDLRTMLVADPEWFNGTLARELNR